jgi:hypothetical protein
MKEKQIEELFWKYAREGTKIKEDRGNKKEKKMKWTPAQNSISFGYTRCPGIEELSWGLKHHQGSWSFVAGRNCTCRPKSTGALTCVHVIFMRNPLFNIK